MRHAPTATIQPLSIEWADTKAVEHFEGYAAAAKVLGIQPITLQTRIASGGGTASYTVRTGEIPRFAVVKKLPLNKTTARAKALLDPERKPTEKELRDYGGETAWQANRDEKSWVTKYREQVEQERARLGYAPPTRAQRKQAVAKRDALLREFPFLIDTEPSLRVAGLPPRQLAKNE